MVEMFYYLSVGNNIYYSRFVTLNEDKFRAKQNVDKFY